MNFSGLSALFLFLSLGLTSAQENAEESGAFKVAVVDIQELFRGYHKTLLAEKESHNVRAEIEKKSQSTQNEIHSLREILKKMEKAVKSGALTDEEVDEMKREGPLLIRDLRLLEKKQKEEQDSASKELNGQVVRRMEKILSEIRQEVQDYAEEAGFDLVVDSSGKNSSQVAPVPFVKDAIDITDSMKRRLIPNQRFGR